MTTSRDIVERAFRKIGVVASDDPMTADQGQSGIDALNMMMHAWVLEGIDVGHADLILGDEFPLQPQFDEGTVYLLAERLAPDYTVPVAFDPEVFKRRLSAAYLIIPDVQFDRTLSRPRRWWRK